jgi:hypothetical protein
MTSEDLKGELEKLPFIPFRMRLVSGKTVDVLVPNAGWMLQNAVLILDRPDKGLEDGYNVVALRNIEMLEQLARPARID